MNKHLCRYTNKMCFTKILLKYEKLLQFWGTVKIFGKTLLFPTSSASST